MGVGSSWPETQLSSFSSSSSGITGFFKAQLVSSCCCLATPNSHKEFSTSLCHHLQDFVFSVLLDCMCLRGIVPSHTKSLKTLNFHMPIFPFLMLVLGKVEGMEGMVRHFCITVSHCPATPVYETLWRYSLRCRHRSTTNFLLLQLRFDLGVGFLLVKIFQVMLLIPFYSLACHLP